jgi:hypothetical protein
MHDGSSMRTPSGCGAPLVRETPVRAVVWDAANATNSSSSHLKGERLGTDKHAERR